MRCLTALALAMSLLPAAPVSTPKFRLKYFHDEDKSSLGIVDFKMLSARRGLAVGTIETNGKGKGVAVVTADAGVTWQQVPLKEMPRSIYFLNESRGWMVTDGGVWQTDESGRSWTKIARQKLALRVWFFDERNGLMVGAPKMVQRTSDGGKTWQKVAEVDKIQASAENSLFNVVSFMSERSGLVMGFYAPPRRRLSRLPDWMDPEAAKLRRQVPGLSMVMETQDAGKTWKTSTTSLFGRATRLAFLPSGVGLLLFEFQDTFDYPSEVYRLGAGKSDRVFRAKDFAVSDVVWDTEGRAYLGGNLPASSVRSIPIPGRVRVQRSSDLLSWEEVAVDYRATASRVRLSTDDQGGVWMATDAGMILKLE